MKGGFFIAAAGQHSGKTTVTLSIMAKLKSKFKNVGYMKPIGQHHILVNGTKIDKDVSVFKKYFNLKNIKYKHMSPLIVDKNYTRRYIENGLLDDQINRIKHSYGVVNNMNDFTLVEGTGHTAVCSVIGMSNAKVASLLNLNMLLVINGGIGNTIDHFELNKAMCDKENVKIGGLIINKVIPSKLDEISYYINKYISTYDIPLIGVVPELNGLDNPTISDIEKLFNRNKTFFNNSNFDFTQIKLVESTLTFFLDNLSVNNDNMLYVTHSSRDDIILGYCSFSKMYYDKYNKKWNSLLIICDSDIISSNMKDLIGNCTGNIITVQQSSSDVIYKIMNYTSKLNENNPDRIKKAITHYSKYIDIDLMNY